MTKQEILRILIRQARTNGFEFRKWFQVKLESPWTNFDDAVQQLSEGRRYYALLFSHDFVRCFWKQGAQISFVVPAASYTRRDKEGHIVTVKRKAFTRRTIKADVWRYHLREMAAAEEPLRYIRRFLMIEEDLKEQTASPPENAAAHPPNARRCIDMRPGNPSRQNVLGDPRARA